MPRPKRTKVAPSVPAPRVRKTAAKPTPPVEPEPQHPKASFNDLYDVSDPEEEVLTSARHAKKSYGKGKAVERPRGRARGMNARSTEDDEIEEAGVKVLEALHHCWIRREVNALGLVLVGGARDLNSRGGWQEFFKGFVGLLAQFATVAEK